MTDNGGIRQEPKQGKGQGLHRKKRPLVVRSQLICVAARLSVEKGLHALTLDAVAREAGVSKGGLLHHFPTKQALLEALHDELLGRFERQFNALLEADPEPRGRFTRAYLHANLCKAEDDGVECWNSLVMLMMGEKWSRPRWSEWLNQRLAELPPHERSVEMEIVRLAADGLFFSDLACPGVAVHPNRERVLEVLEEMTRK
ncbi:TetR/AcrR family transcriptional regulator [Xanthobacter sp. TB0136]|uniref:TetR/AcrR family transcriptional regulator n=1 Tax=Xanthobacter sp. TB0136 TaxID=3459177 RepID=UPI00403A5753